MIKLRAKANLLLLVVLVSGCAPIAPEWRALRDSPAPAASITVPVKYGGEVLERPCDLYIPANEVEGQTIRCGFVRVPWDRSEPADATTDLAFVILKATGDHPRPDAIIHVAGGPGAGSTLRDAGLEFIKRYAPLREERDVILYDQRGIGNSLPFFACGYPDEAAAAGSAAPQRPPRANPPPVSRNGPRGASRSTPSAPGTAPPTWSICWPRWTIRRMTSTASPMARACSWR
jgi:pimeloyl-ACP methyl ester carboxylesterase